MGEGRETTIEAGDREGSGEIAQAAQDAQGAFVMIGKLTGSDDTHGEDFAVASAGTGIGAMTEGAQQVVKDDIDGYNPGVVHRSFLRRRVVSATPFSGIIPMNDD